ncbi:DUF2165 family protein [Hyalangium versicolor]|uniref:DUF2165 family protein n=1 Tax=Hyalangium versicolor TaxID=2861190 RepID=UPI001CCDD430|nr:DUF2165 family protein [Hyalangium versicolor]
METPILIPLFLKIVILMGVSVWLTLAVINNIMDPATNISMIGQMMRMDPIENAPHLGAKLRRRAVTSPHAHKRSFYIATIIQIIAAVLMWRGAVMLIIAAWGPENAQALAHATAAVNLGLGVLVVLWLWFLCGGLWFGYWLRMPQVQQTHMTMLFTTLLMVLMVNVG